MSWSNLVELYVSWSYQVGIVSWSWRYWLMDDEKYYYWCSKMVKRKAGCGVYVVCGVCEPTALQRTLFYQMYHFLSVDNPE